MFEISRFAIGFAIGFGLIAISFLAYTFKEFIKERRGLRALKLAKRLGPRLYFNRCRGKTEKALGIPWKRCGFELLGVLVHALSGRAPDLCRDRKTPPR